MFVGECTGGMVTAIRPTAVIGEWVVRPIPLDHHLETSRLTSIELFTGAGGLALATHLNGFHHRLLLEWNSDACRTLSWNARAESVPGIDEWTVCEGDARNYDFASLGQVDLVAGGPPCQPFSIGGKHRGWDDSRDMIPQFVRAVRETAPRAFIMENVKGLTRSTFRPYFDYVLQQLSHPTFGRRGSETWLDHRDRLAVGTADAAHEELRYNVAFRLLNSADYGVPQTRQRVFIIGFRSDLGLLPKFPEPTHDRHALLRDQSITGAYWDRHGLPRPIASPGLPTTTRLVAIDDSLPRRAWVTVRDALRDLPKPNAEEDVIDGFVNHRLRPGARSYKGHTGSAIDWPAKTLKAGDHGVPGGENMIAFPDGSVRYFTVREAARIQTFPDAWHFEGAWSEAMRQLGNAVPVSLAHAVAEKVVSQLGAGVDRLPVQPTRV